MVIDSDSRKSVVKVSISKVSVELGGKQILNNVSMEIPSGSFTAIVGPNGSGKTTLLRAIFGALKPQTGTITFDDLNIRGQTTRQLARLRSVVPQGQDAHSDLTVKTTIELARLSQVKWWQNALLRGDEVVDQAIATTGIAPMLSQPMATLSGGQRQRVLIARAIAQDTPIVLLDEPTIIWTRVPDSKYSISSEIWKKQGSWLPMTSIWHCDIATMFTCLKMEHVCCLANLAMSSNQNLFKMCSACEPELSRVLSRVARIYSPTERANNPEPKRLS